MAWRGRWFSHLHRIAPLGAAMHGGRVTDLDVDLKLLLALEAIVDERNVTKAAKRVGLSQPR